MTFAVVPGLVGENEIAGAVETAVGIQELGLHRSQTGVLIHRGNKRRAAIPIDNRVVVQEQHELETAPCSPLVACPAEAFIGLVANDGDVAAELIEKRHSSIARSVVDDDTS